MRTENAKTKKEKNTKDALNSRMEGTKERIHGPEESTIEIAQFEHQRENSLEKKKVKSLRSNSHVTEVSEEKIEEKMEKLPNSCLKTCKNWQKI